MAAYQADHENYFAAGWSFSGPGSSHKSCFHYESVSNVLAVDGHAQTIECEPAGAAYHARTLWGAPQKWFPIEE